LSIICWHDGADRNFRSSGSPRLGNIWLAPLARLRLSGGFRV